MRGKVCLSGPVSLTQSFLENYLNRYLTCYLGVNTSNYDYKSESIMLFSIFSGRCHCIGHPLAEQRRKTKRRIEREIVRKGRRRALSVSQYKFRLDRLWILILSPINNLNSSFSCMRFVCVTYSNASTSRQWSWSLHWWVQMIESLVDAIQERNSLARQSVPNVNKCYCKIKYQHMRDAYHKAINRHEPRIQRTPTPSHRHTWY